MKNFTSSFKQWAKQLKGYHAQIKPLLVQPHDSNSAKKINQEIEALAIGPELTQILTQIRQAYPTLNASQRTSVIELMAKNHYVHWADTTNYSVTGAASFERAVLWFIIKDQGRDTRDAILELNQIVRQGQQLEINTNQVLKKMLPLAATQDKFGWGSTHALIQQCITN